MSILIRNGKVVTASESYKADVYIEGEKIIAIGNELNYDADKIIDASNKLVFPGGIDPHVHLIGIYCEKLGARRPKFLLIFFLNAIIIFIK